MDAEIKKIKVRVTLLEDMLGTVPKNKEIFGVVEHGGAA